MGWCADGLAAWGGGGSGGELGRRSALFRSAHGVTTVWPRIASSQRARYLVARPERSVLLRLRLVGLALILHVRLIARGFVARL